MRAFLVLAGLAASLTAAAPSWPGGDGQVRPGDDFFWYANGGWAAHTVIPPDRAGVSIGSTLRDRLEGDLHTILEQAAAQPASGAPSDDLHRVGAYYAAFMDARRIEQLGATPLGPDLSAIRSAVSREDLARLMGEANGSFQGSLFSLTVDVDEGDPDHYALHLAQGGLGLPGRSDYLDAAAAPLRSAYHEYAAHLLGLLGWSDPQGAADAVLAFETKVAAASWTAVQERDDVATYNPTTLAGLKRLAPDFAWDDYFAGAGLRPGRLIVVERAAIPALARLYASTSLVDLKAWAAVRLADDAAPDLSQPFYDAWFELHGRRLQGLAASPPRWQRALLQVSGGGSKTLDESRGALGDAVGRLYLALRFDPRSEAELITLADQLRVVLRSRIKTSAWMSVPAKVEALRKLDAYRVDVGTPEHSDSYDGLAIRRDDLYGDVQRATAYAWTDDQSRLDQPVDRGRWAMTTQTVNAYNSAPLRQVVFSAALLQSPAFDPGEDAALRYGGMGAIIGHELTHAFDDEGRRFDHTGRLRNWWTKADEARFSAMANRLVKRFSGCEVLPGVMVDGRLTLGENLADIGGLQLAFAAYHASLRGQPAPVIDGFTGDQRFFLGFALLRRGVRRPEALRYDVRTDPHTPDRCRVNEDVREVDGWYDAFGIKPDRRLALSKGETTTVW